MSGHHGRDQWQKLTLAAEKDGTVTGLKVELLADLGAYVGHRRRRRAGARRVDVQLDLQVPGLPVHSPDRLTNKTWVDAYRGAGRPEATYAIERLMDELAAEVGVDPLEIREKNWITHDEFPFTTVAGMTYDSGNYEAATAKATELFGYDELRAEQQRRRDSKRPGAARHRRLDLHRDVRPGALARPRARSTTAPAAGSTRRSGCSPPARSRSHRHVARTARATRRRGARSSPTGSACRSRTSRCCTATPRSCPRAWTPTARGPSSSVVRRWCKAADKVIEKAKPIAAHLLEANVDDLEFSGGRFSVKGTDKGVAHRRGGARHLDRPQPARRHGAEPRRRRDVRRRYNFSFPHGTHLCAMEVDTETGASTMRKYVCVDDIGTIINPLIVEGQVHGGLVQGIAQALWEGAEYDENGTLVTGSFVDYTLPTAADTISFVVDNTVTALDDQHAWAPRGSARPAASPPPRRSSTRSSMPCATSASTTSLMPCTPERVWKAIQAPGRTPATVTSEAPAALRGRRTQPGPLSGRDGRSGTVIPAAFDYLAPDHRRRGPRGARRGRRRRQGDRWRPVAAADPADAAQRTRDARRPRADRGAARHPRRRRRTSSSAP